MSYPNGQLRLGFSLVEDIMSKRTVSSLRIRPHDVLFSG